MRILQVFSSKVKKHGSFEDFMIELAKQAQEKNISLSFAFPGINSQDVKSQLEQYKADVFEIPVSWESFTFVTAILKIAIKEKITALDFHFCSSIYCFILFLLLRMLGKKVIFHYHGEIRPIEELKFFNRHFSRVRIITLFVNKIICVSYANKRFMEALHIQKRIEVVYNGIKVANFENIDVNDDFKKRLGINAGELVVTSIGTLIPRKGMDVLINAAKLVLHDLPQTKFIIVGGGDKEPYVMIARQLNIEDKIIFTGLLQEYPFDILKSTDVYVSASFAESFGLSIAEAEILEIPVVATRVGGVLEVVNDGNTGFLVTSGDSKALAEKISLLLKDSALRKEMGRKGKKWACDNFDLKRKVEELLEVLFKIK